MEGDQAALVAWVWGQRGVQPPAGLRPVGAQPLARGLSAYREHAKALAVRALASRFPLLQQLPRPTARCSPPDWRGRTPARTRLGRAT